MNPFSVAPLELVHQTGFFGDTRPPYSASSPHNGVDLRAAVGTPIRSPAAGVVSSVWSADRGGLQMLVEHDNGYRTGYAHLSSTLAVAGQRVRAGQVIAKSGNSGGVDAHLHFTLRDPSHNTVDAWPFLSSAPTSAGGGLLKIGALAFLGAKLAAAVLT